MPRTAGAQLLEAGEPAVAKDDDLRRLDLDRPALARSVPTDRAYYGAGMATDGLLERERELAELDALIEQACEGRGRSAVVEGPAGICKSRLIAEARSRAERSTLVLSARGSELEREFSFGVVRQLFETAVANPQRRERLLAGAAAPAASVFGEPDAARASGADGASFAALHGLFWLTLNLAEERPLLLAIDDLHWCDRPSLLFVAYLTRRLETVPILLLAGLRTAEPGTDAALLGEIAQDPPAVSIRPAPLSDGAVGALVGERLGSAPDDAFRAACRDSTGGNPLLLQQLIAALRGEGVRPDAASAGLVRDIGPRAVSRTVLLRLARLPAEATAVARWLAVLGEGASLPTLAQAAGVDETSVAEATRWLAQAEILRPDPPLGFVHPLVRDAVYHELPPGERELQHARGADVLRNAGAPAEEVAAQLLHTSAPGEAWAAELLTEAGRRAMRSGAPDSAVAYFQRALDEQPPDGARPQLLLELGVAEALISGPAATEHLRAAYESIEDPVARGMAVNVLGRTLLFAGSADEAAALAGRAAAELPSELAELRSVLEALDLMTSFFRAGFPELLERAKAYRGRPAADGAGTNLLAAIASVQWAYTEGSADECAELALAALAGGALLAVDDNLISICPIVTLALADRDEAVGACEALRDHAHRQGSLFSASAFHGWWGFTLLRRGDLAEAEEMLRTSDAQAELWGFAGTAQVYLSALLSDTLLARGDTAAARRVLERTPYAADGSDRWRWWLNSKLELLLAERRDEEGLEAADEFDRHYGALVNPAAARSGSARARALHRLGQADEALELMSENLRLARRWGAAGTVARALRELGELQGEAGLPLLAEAVEVVDGSLARLEHARALAALGAALRRARRPTEAREPLREALELASRCGAEGVVEHARSELHASGARPRREALSGPAALTPSERRVVDLAAAGQTNRDIAQELYVTPKTVEVHLSNAYRKLGIGSRRELTAALSAA
jgi:DNA-binding NarL/FixJ family response regulator